MRYVYKHKKTGKYYTYIGNDVEDIEKAFKYNKYEYCSLDDKNSYYYYYILEFDRIPYEKELIENINRLRKLKLKKLNETAL